jgi:serine/threonine-protein kinase RsbT
MNFAATSTRTSLMKPLKGESLPIQSSADVVLARQKVRQWATEMKFTLVDQTKLVTAASELARNTLDHGKGGRMIIEIIENLGRQGLRLVFEDKGPGIPDIQAALRDGFTTGHGMGLGLGGSKRLVNEFEISSTPGQGTRVTVIRWK